MEYYLIEGGRRIEGELRVQGSKNGALPILAATVVTGCTSILHRCPCLRDTDAALHILRHIGCDAVRSGESVIVRADAPQRWEIPESLMRCMRSSIIFLGALIARFGRAELTAPGGCEIGLRPIDLHVSALSALGVKTDERGGKLCCHAPNGLHGANITLSFPSVGATENILLCAVCAEGDTVIRNAAREPEISDLASFLNGCGARITGAGSDTIVVSPTGVFRANEHTIMPDRIAAATYLSTAAVTGGSIRLRESAPDSLLPVLPYFEQCGCVVRIAGDDVLLQSPQRLRAPRLVRTMPYPGFPTDFQPSAMVMAAVSLGTGVFVETIFENRFRHVPQLRRMGAHITVQSNVAVVEGVPRLNGAIVYATDLRGGAALVNAALCAEGETRIGCIGHIDRGYENFEHNLALLGAGIKRIDSDAE
ncbi:MAG: UDP-N-acetylglucosamine 1-carboxyvinyltransferase [Clostridia bacterium]|nr:UDP-N-acetylglucosamine 1-carboxyvinyltransferase [Clostridia bacterium]